LKLWLFTAFERVRAIEDINKRMGVPASVASTASAFSSASKWTEATRSNPCPICGKPDWCSISTDGAWAVCRRVDTGDGLHRVDKSGGDYWLYRIDGGGDTDNGTQKDVAADYSEISQPVLAPADPDTLDKVYRALLQELSLSAVHRENLRKRGLSDEEIDLRGYKTLVGPGRAKLAKTMVGKFGNDVCKKIPGLFIKQGERKPYWTLAGSAGIVIPLRDVRGRIVALKSPGGQARRWAQIFLSHKLGKNGSSAGWSEPDAHSAPASSYEQLPSKKCQSQADGRRTQSRHRNNGAQRRT
jgi:hypothetical protein